MHLVKANHLFFFIRKNSKNSQWVKVNYRTFIEKNAKRNPSLNNFYVLKGENSGELPVPHLLKNMHVFSDIEQLINDINRNFDSRPKLDANPINKIEESVIFKDKNYNLEELKKEGRPIASGAGILAQKNIGSKDFSRYIILEGDLRGIEFIDGTDFNSVTGISAMFANCRIYKANFKDAVLERANLSSAIACYSNFYNVNLSRSICVSTNFSNSIIVGAKFDFSDLSGANFRNVKALSDIEDELFKGWNSWIISFRKLAKCYILFSLF